MARRPHGLSLGSKSLVPAAVVAKVGMLIKVLLLRRQCRVLDVVPHFAEVVGGTHHRVTCAQAVVAWGTRAVRIEMAPRRGMP